MAVTYTTAVKVASLMRLIVPSTQARLVFGAATDPTITEVEVDINEAEDYIDKQTNHAWRAVTITNEYHDVDALFSGLYRRETPIKLKHRSIRTLVSGTDKIEIWNGTSWIELVSTKTEGRANDFWLDYTNGIIFFVDEKPYYANQGVRVTYRYGESAVPLDIQEAATKLAACKIAETEDYKILLPENVSQYAIASKVESWKKDIEKILWDRKEIITGAI